MSHPYMQCPRCRGPMQSYPRSGVQIEQCTQCRGIFLDEAELATLGRNEAQWGPGGMPPGAGPGPGPGPGYGGYGGGYGPGPGGYGPDPGPGPGPGYGYGGGYAGGYGPHGPVWGSVDPNNPAPPPDPPPQER